SGALLGPDGTEVGVGYSGQLPYRNNPSHTNVKGEGPIPVGLYTVSVIVDANGQPCDHTTSSGSHLKAPVLRLTPYPTNEMFGRDDFLCHGDNTTHTASDGCIIQAHDVRSEWASSADHELIVVPGVPEHSETLEEA